MTIYLFIAMLLWAPPQTSPKYGTIEGIVTRFGTDDPIADVEIVITGSGRSTNGLSPQAATDSRGHFVIGDLLPGSYSIRAQRLGYANPAPNGVRVLEGGTTRTVAVAAGKRTENANLTMVRAGAIYGRILDSAGKPLVNHNAFVNGIEDRAVVRARTDDRGDYHVVNVPPGKYNLLVDSEPLTYFPGVPDKARAVVLEINEGTVLTGMDMTVNNGLTAAEPEKVFNISGRILDRDGVPMEGFFDLLLHTPAGAAKQILYKQLGVGLGSFYSTGVRPGRYDLILYFNDSRSFFGNSSLLGAIGRVEVSVGDRDVTDVVLTPGGVSVNGQVATIGNAPGPSATIRLKMPSHSVQSRESKTGTAGEFSIPNVISGIWKVAVSDLPSDRALLDVRQDGISVYENGFSVEDRTPKSVQVLLGPGGSVSGIVRNEQNAPVGAAQVLLIADAPDPSHPAKLFRKATTDGTGRLTVSNVAVGSYKVYALDPANFSSESIPDTAEAVSRLLSPEIRSKGVAATVSSGGKLELSLTSIH